MNISDSFTFLNFKEISIIILVKYVMVYKNRASKMKFFGAKEFLHDFFLKNGRKNEFNDNNEKSCSWSRNKVSGKIDFKVQWLRNSHADSVRVNNYFNLRFEIGSSCVAHGRLQVAMCLDPIKGPWKFSYIKKWSLLSKKLWAMNLLAVSYAKIFTFDRIGSTSLRLTSKLNIK